MDQMTGQIDVDSRFIRVASPTNGLDLSEKTQHISNGDLILERFAERQSTSSRVTDNGIQFQLSKYFTVVLTQDINAI